MWYIFTGFGAVPFAPDYPLRYNRYPFERYRRYPYTAIIILSLFKAQGRVDMSRLFLHGIASTYLQFIRRLFLTVSIKKSGFAVLLWGFFVTVAIFIVPPWITVAIAVIVVVQVFHVVHHEQHVIQFSLLHQLVGKAQ